MKKIILMAIAMVMTLSVAEASAATKEKKVAETEKTVFVTDINCDHCVQKVMNYMPYQKGVKSVDVDLPKKQVTVSYDLSKASEAKVIKYFSKIDVNAKKYEEPKAPAKEEPKTTTQSQSKTQTTSNSTSNNRR